MTAIIHLRLDPTRPNGSVHVNDDYVSMFWLPVIGPTSFCVARWAQHELRDEWAPWPLMDLSRAFGLGGSTSTHSPIQRTLRRLVQFRWAVWDDPAEERLLLRSYVMPLTPRRVAALPDFLSARHERWALAAANARQ